MANEKPSVTSLFGGLLTPQEMRDFTQRQDLARGVELAQIAPESRGLLYAPQAVTAAGRLGRRIGGQDPRTPQEIRMEENRQLFTQIAQQAQQQFPSDRTAQLNFIADRLNEAGKVGEAQKARALAQQSAQTAQQTATSRAQELKALAEKEKAERASPITEIIGKVNPQDYTPDSIEKFKTSGKYSDLQRVERQEGDTRTQQQKNFETYEGLLAKGDTEKARKFGVAAGFIPEMSVALQKEHINSMNTAMESRANSLRYNDLATDIINAEEFKGGAYASWEEAYKEFTGNTDAVSLLKTRYRGIRASAAVNNLPPGAASDADVRLALSGVPPENANAETVAQFLRGLAKLEAEVAAYNAAKVAYLDSNRDLIGFDEEYQKSRKRVEDKQKGTTRTTAGGVTYEVIE